MSGVDAAATLSLQIDTKSAQENIDKLNAAYNELHANMSKKVGADLGGEINKSVKSLQGSLATVAALINSTNNALDDIVAAGSRSFAKISTEAKNAAQAVVTLSEAMRANTAAAQASSNAATVKLLKERAEAATLAAEAEKRLAQVTAANISSAQASSNAATVKLLKERAEAATLAAEAEKRLAQVTAANISSAQASSNAATVKLLKERAEAATLAAEAEKRLAQVTAANISSAQASSNAATVKLLKERAEAATLAAEAEKRLAQVTAANISSAQASSNAATVKLLKERAEAATLAAEAEKRLAQVTAANISSAQASSNAATVKLLKERAEAATLAAEAEKRLAQVAAANISSAQASSNAATQRLIQQRTSGTATPRYNPLMNTVDTAVSATQSASAIKELDSAHKSLAPSVKQNTENQVHWNTIANEAHGAARGLSGALGGLWLTYGSLAPLLGAAVIAGSMKSMVETGKELEFQFTMISAISSGATVDMQKFNDAVSGTMSTPLEAAKGLRVLAQAGLSVEDATTALPSVLKLAAVGETDMANAALSATAIMHSFGLSVNDFGHIGDVFAKAAAISATSVKEMMEAMKQASAISNMFGVSMEETAASLATLANRGIEGSAAGTAITNMVRELSAPTTAKATAAMKQLGIEIYNADGSLKPFTERLQQLSEATNSMTEQGKTRFLEDIFNNRAVKAANILLTDLTKMKQSLEDTQLASEGLGFMTEAQIKLSQSTEGLLKTLQGDFQRVLADVFSGVQPQIASIINSLSGVVNSSGMKEFLTTTADVVAKLTQALLDNLDAVKTFAAAYLTFKGIEVASAAFIILGRNIKLVTDGLKALALVDLAATAANTAAAAQTAAAATAAAATASSTVVASRAGVVATALANIAYIASSLATPLAIAATGLGALVALGVDWYKTLHSISEEGRNSIKVLDDYATSTAKVSAEVSKGVDALYASGVALKEQIRLMGAGQVAADAYAASIRNAPALMANEALDKSKEILDRAKARYAAGPQGGGDATAESREARQLLNDLTEAQKAHDKVLENHSKVLNDVTKANAMAAEQGYDKQLIKQAEAARGLNEQWEKMKRDGTDAEKLLASKSYAVGLSAEQAEATRKRLQQLADQKNKTANLKPLADDPNKELASSAELLARRQQLQAVLSDYEPKKAETAARTQKRYVDNQKKLDDSRIKGLVEAQQFEIQLLESKHSNHLISEDEFQKELAAIYKKNEKEIEESYGASLIRLTQLARAAQGDQKVQADRLLQDEWNAYNKYESDRTLRLQKATDRNLGIVKKGHEDTLKFIAEQEVAVKQLQDKLTETRLKLDMTPAQSAGYDARRDSEKATDKFIAKKQSDINAQLKMSPEVPVEENNVLKAMLEDLDKLYEAKERLAAQSASIAEQDVEFQRSYEFGWKNAYKNWADDATNAAKQAADSFSVMSSAIDKALTDFLTTGKVNFAQFAKSIILGIAEIEAKALLAEATKGKGFGGIVQSILGMLGMGGSSGISGGTIPGVMTNGIPSMIGTSSARGNVFSGSPSLHQYANTVQTSPVTFSFDKLHKFARGGVFAEAGPEAVMPLTRDSAGRLGVKAQGGGRTYNITVNVNGNNNAQDVRRAAGQGAREAASFISAAHRYV
jgi:TP901 family phage tail tape measure protein/lambda family phage tail tape measure protein